MVSSPISSWQIEGEKVEAVTDFVILGSRITADTDCSHEIKRRLLLGKRSSLEDACFLGRKAMTNLDSVLKAEISLPTKVYIVKAMVFPVVMYGCESWTIRLSTKELTLSNCGPGEDC